MEVFLLKKANQSLLNLINYLSDEIKVPETAAKFADRMLDFVLSLGDTPMGWPVCRDKLYFIRGFRCAVFEKKWIIVYYMSDNKVVIYDIVNGKLITDI